MTTVLSRPDLRQLLDETTLADTQRPRFARQLIIHFDNDAQILWSQDCSIRDQHGILITESPAPLNETEQLTLNQSLRDLCERLATLERSGPWIAEIALSNEQIHVEQLRHADGETQHSNQGHCIRCVLRADSNDKLQSWRGHDTAMENNTLTIFAEPGDIVAKNKCLAELNIEADTRQQCLEQASQLLETVRCDGPETNRIQLLSILTHNDFTAGRLLPTLSLCKINNALQNLLIIESAGIQTSVQDVHGRLGYWEIGVPPSGPMDNLSFALANEAVGNTAEHAGLEITIGGFIASFTNTCVIAIGGAPSPARIDGKRIELFKPITVEAGSRIEIPPAPAGFRSYLAIRGGIDTSIYLGSRSTFTLGAFGGFRGRELKSGDRLPLGNDDNLKPATAIAPERHPRIESTWEIGVRLGPHTSPDFITEAGIEEFFSSEWTVSPQSNRTGIRLNGPKPQWARSDGGEAGLHPSNLHDNAYAFGSIDLTGDLPVVLGPDGPSLGGFVCPGVVISGQRWKLGQLKPGDRVRWVIVDEAAADTLRKQPAQIPQACSIERPEIITHRNIPEHPGRCIRRQGDEFVLIEFGEMELELGLRLRVQALYDKLQESDTKGIIDLVPGIRSLQIHFNPDLISESTLTKLIITCDDDINAGNDLVLPSRSVHLPLSWDDPSTRKAIEIYMQTVNPDAPWCPWNIEFIRRINGLDSVEQVYQTVFDANYLVYGLGDVYLGAPVASPIDPRHRLVTTKYNPARTWTPENAVGIGGAYLCIYGMEGPGGYQFVGRTVQVWNSHPRSDCFTQPWLLRQFDQLNFYPVSADELLTLRDEFPKGLWQPRIESSQISLAEQLEFAKNNAEEIATARKRQQQAFAAERQRWAEQA